MILWVPENDFMNVKRLGTSENRALVNSNLKPLVMSFTAVAPQMIEVAKNAGYQIMSPDPDDWEWTGAIGEDEQSKLKSFARHNTAIGYVEEYAVLDSLGNKTKYLPAYNRTSVPDFRRDPDSDEDLADNATIEISLRIEDPTGDSVTHVVQDSILLIRDMLFATPSYTLEVVHKESMPNVSVVVHLIAGLQEYLATGDSEFHCAIEGHLSTDTIELTNEVEHALNPDLSKNKKGPITIAMILNTFGISEENLREHAEFLNS